MSIKYPFLYVGGAFLIALFGTSVGAIVITAPSFKLGDKPVNSPFLAKQTITVPQRIDTLLQAGLKAYNRGAFEVAKIDLETARLLSPSPLPTLSMATLVDCYIVTGDFKRGIELSEELIIKEPNNPSLYTRLGLGLLLSGKYSDAAKTLDDALQIDDNERTAMLYLGLAHKLMGEESKMEEIFTTAKEQYDQILLINEEDLQSLIELATLHLYWEKDTEVVEKLLAKAKEVAEKGGSDSAINIISRFYIPMLEGTLYYQDQKYNDSLIKLTLALQNAPQGIHSDLVKIYYFVGKNYIQLLQTDQAKKFFTRAIEIAPEHYYAKEMQNFLEKN